MDTLGNTFVKVPGFHTIPTTTPYASVFGVRAPSVDTFPQVEDGKAYVPMVSKPLVDSFQHQSSHFSPSSIGAQFNQFRLMARKRAQSSEPVSVTYGFQQHQGRSDYPQQVGVRVLQRNKQGKTHFVADVVAYNPLDFGQNLTLASGARQQLPQLEKNRVPEATNAYRFTANGRIALAKELNVETKHRPMAQRIVNGLRQATEYLKPIQRVVSVKPDNTVTVFGHSFNPVDVYTDVESGQRVQPLRLMRFGQQVIQVQNLDEKGLTGKVFSTAKDALSQLTQWTAQLEQVLGYERQVNKTRFYQTPLPNLKKAAQVLTASSSPAPSPSVPKQDGLSIAGFNPSVLKRLSTVPNPFEMVGLSDVAQGLTKAVQANQNHSE